MTLRERLEAQAVRGAEEYALCPRANLIAPEKYYAHVEGARSMFEVVERLAEALKEIRGRTAGIWEERLADEALAFLESKLGEKEGG